MAKHQELIDTSIEKLRHSFNAQKLYGLSARKEVLQSLLAMVSDNQEEIIKALKEDLGRPAFESFVAEVAFIKQEIKLALKKLSSWTKEKPVKTPLAFLPGKAYIKPCPKGVVLLIAPWNYPFQLSLVPLVSALAAGNTVLLKPSEIAESSQNLLKTLLNRYVDSSLVEVLCGGATFTQSLLEREFDHIFYTGGGKVAQKVLEAAAKHICPTTLELGGKSPVIIDATADLDLAAKRILWGKCMNAGQTCIAPDYVLIEGKADAFIDYLKNHMQKMFEGDVNKSPHFARIINQAHLKRLASYLEGQKPVFGGNYDLSQKFFAPTLVLNPKLDSSLMREEIFGPILPIIEVGHIDEAIKIIKSKEHPLAMYVFSNNDQQIKSILNKTLSGSVAINDCLSQVAISSLPFGGLRHSGMGSYHGYYGFATFTHFQSIYKRSNYLDNPIKYPPYNDKKMRLAQSLL